METRPADGAAVMHEIGIAQNILEIVRQSVPEDQAAAVRGIRVRIGELSGIIPDSLDFCFSALVSETEMRRASLVMDTIPTISLCKDCRQQFTVENYDFSCPSCNGGNLELVAGKELEVVEIELAE
jgi:hydrogenase nickel incorporation protein HypA/HybF